MRFRRGAAVGATAIVLAGLSLTATASTAIAVAGPVSGPSNAAAAVVGDEGKYFPNGPFRIMDTRTGLGVPKGKIGATGVARLQVTGIHGVPTENVAAVVLNVTVTNPTRAGYLTVFPTGVPRPTASSLNFPAGFTGANSVTATVGTGGQIDIYNSAGTTDVIVDLMGYYLGTATAEPPLVGGQYQPVVPIRLIDTRQLSGPVPSRFFIPAPASISDEIDPHVKAFAVNITAVAPTGPGYLTAWDGASPLPLASTLNFTTNKVVPNFAVVPVAPCVNCGGATGWPSIGVYTNRTTHIIVDLVGFYDDSTVPDGLRFAANVPTRITDTRLGLGWPARLGPQVTATVTTPSSLAGPDTFALAMNVTAVSPTAATYLTVWPADLARPVVSNLNPSAGAVVANAAQTLISPENKFSVYNNSGNIHVVIDVVGTFYLPSESATSMRTAQAYEPSAQRRDGLLSSSGSSLLRQPK